jgi:hypothetical protein
MMMEYTIRNAEEICNRFFSDLRDFVRRQTRRAWRWKLNGNA